MRGPLVFALGLAVLAAAAGAQQGSAIGKGMLDPNAPIDVSADNFVADSNAKTGVYTGNVIVNQGEMHMRCNNLRAHLVDNKPDKIYVQGHVVVDAPKGVATGDSGVYDVNPRIITLTGNVVLTQGPNVMRGHQLVVNLLSGEATLVGGANRTGRVQALFSPRTETATGANPTQNP